MDNLQRKFCSPNGLDNFKIINGMLRSNICVKSSKTLLIKNKLCDYVENDHHDLTLHYSLNNEICHSFCCEKNHIVHIHNVTKLYNKHKYLHSLNVIIHPNKHNHIVVIFSGELRVQHLKIIINSAKTSSYKMCVLFNQTNFATIKTLFVPSVYDLHINGCKLLLTLKQIIYYNCSQIKINSSNQIISNSIKYLSPLFVIDQNFKNKYCISHKSDYADEYSLMRELIKYVKIYNFKFIKYDSLTIPNYNVFSKLKSNHKSLSSIFVIEREHHFNLLRLNSILNNITDLQLHFNTIISANVFNSISKMINLRNLSLKNISNPTKKIPQSFYNLINLSNLYFNNFVVDAIDDQFVNFKSLKSFTLINNNDSLRRLHINLLCMPSLQSITLDRDCSMLKRILKNIIKCCYNRCDNHHNNPITFCKYQSSIALPDVIVSILSNQFFAALFGCGLCTQKITLLPFSLKSLTLNCSLHPQLRMFLHVFN